MSNVVPIKGAQMAPKAYRSRMDTIVLTLEMVDKFRLPIIQRPLKINEKVKRAIEIMKQTETIEGVITLGHIGSDTAVPTYIVDGQHRIEAFKLSGLQAVYADVRVMTFANMGELAEEYVRCQQSLVKMQPDDTLRGMEPNVPALRAIRKACEFVGYGQVRRGGKSGALLSMSALLRCWSAAGQETPAPGSSGLSGPDMAEAMDQTSLQNLIAFLSVAHAAWGRDPEYYRLWSALNLTLCMWLWNRLVIDRERGGNYRIVLLSIPEFKKCLMSVSADGDYLSWLPGRNLNDRDRSPAYVRLKSIFARRLKDEGHNNPKLPSPPWASK